MNGNKLLEYLDNIREDYSNAKNYVTQNPKIVAGSVRASLENTVKFFWAFKFNKEWDSKNFNLSSAINDKKFSSFFTRIEIGDMNIIRETCNGVLHGSSDLNLSDAQELIKRLEKVIVSIENILGVDILKSKKEYGPAVKNEHVHNHTVGNPIPDKLIRDEDYSYGTRAQIIYDDCCDKFNWNKNMRGSFGPQRLLYAKEVTPEKYSVWFIANSNWSGTKGGTWRNYVQGETITEYWDSSARAGLQDKDIRLTFAKKLIDGKYGYAFIGIYDVKSIVFNQVSQKWVKTYKLIKEQYPD